MKIRSNQLAGLIGGSTQEPEVAGSLDFKNFELGLPAGIFSLPQARIEFTNASSVVTGGPLIGMTAAGPCTLGLGGTLQHPEISFQGPEGATAPDMLVSLATKEPMKISGELLPQECAWTRQDNLFPVPAASWATSRLGDYAQGSLGFYGAPWIWNWRATPAAAQSPQR